MGQNGDTYPTHKVMKQAQLGEGACRNHMGAIKLEVRAAKGAATLTQRAHAPQLERACRAGASNTAASPAAVRATGKYRSKGPVSGEHPSQIAQPWEK
jgi:hypothetical protein